MRSLMDNEIISFTTRQPRPGEIDGEDYIFITEEEFDYLLNNDGLVEWTEYGGNYYGITKQELETKLNNNHAFVIVDYNGMVQLSDMIENNVTIFIYNDLKTATLQLEGRGENQDFINKRLSTYFYEVDNKTYYDYVVKNINGKLDNTIEIVLNIIEANIEGSK